MVRGKTQHHLKNPREYFEEHLSVGDYYNQEQRVAGEWSGCLKESVPAFGKYVSRPRRRALDRVERLLTVLGSRLLESQKRVSESAEALSIRQAGESSIIVSISASVTAAMNEVLRWIYWWHSNDSCLRLWRKNSEPKSLRLRFPSRKTRQVFFQLFLFASMHWLSSRCAWVHAF